jgi:hypothetical protein
LAEALCESRQLAAFGNVPTVTKNPESGVPELNSSRVPLRTAVPGAVPSVPGVVVGATNGAASP